MTPQSLGQGLRLAIKEVIHHYDILSSAIVHARGDIAARDPHSGDARLVKYDSEEGKAAIARQGWDDAAEEQIAVGVKVLDPGTGIPVSVFVNIREDRAKTGDRRRFAATTGRDGHEEGHVGDVAANRAE